MSITQLTRDMHIIAKLDDEPNDTGGLTAAQLKDKFDEAGVAIQTYLNATLIPEVEKAVAGVTDLNAPTRVSLLENDAGYQTAAQVEGAISAALGGYDPGVEVPTAVSQLENDADYQTGAQVTAAILAAIADIPTASGVNF